MEEKNIAKMCQAGHTPEKQQEYGIQHFLRHIYESENQKPEIMSLLCENSLYRFKDRMGLVYCHIITQRG
jgi:hypothetical protein